MFKCLLDETNQSNIAHDGDEMKEDFPNIFMKEIVTKQKDVGSSLSTSGTIGVVVRMSTLDTNVDGSILRINMFSP